MLKYDIIINSPNLSHVTLVLNITRNPIHSHSHFITCFLHPNLSKAEMKALNNLRKGKTIKILVADKNAGTVVMDTQCILV